MYQNKEKWGSSNWISFLQTVDIKDMQLSNYSFVLNSKDEIGEIEINNSQFLVKSNIYLVADYASDSNQAKINQSINNISFSMFLKEILTNSDRESISEIQILTNSVFNDISAYIFILASILL